MSVPAPLSFQEQADLVDRLVSRCVMRGGDVAGETTLMIDRETADNLTHLAMRLQRLAPHEDRIRKMVMGK